MQVHENLTEFANALAKLRNDQHLTQGEFANKIGVDGSTIGNWEKRAFRPSEETYNKLIRTYPELANIKLPPTNKTNKPPGVGEQPRKPYTRKPGKIKFRGRVSKNQLKLLLPEANLSLRDRLASIRKTLNLTHQQLATRLGVTPVTISHWESGAAKPQKENLKAVENLEAIISGKTQTTNQAIKTFNVTKEDVLSFAASLKTMILNQDESNFLSFLKECSKLHLSLKDVISLLG